MNISNTFKKNRSFLLYITIGSLLVFQFFLFFSVNLFRLDPDLGWHLRIGEEIISSHAVPHIETHTLLGQGQSWADHEWLSNIIFYGLYSHDHFISLAILCSLIIVLSFFLVDRIIWIIHRDYGGRFLSFLIILVPLQIYCSFVLLDFVAVRPQILSWLFFTIVLFILFRLIYRSKLNTLYVLPLLFLLWTNMHGGFLLGLLMILSSFSFFLIFMNHNRSAKTHIIIITVLSILTTFCTPYGIDLWIFILTAFTENTYYTTHIIEWLPVYYLPVSLMLHLLFIFLALALFIVFLTHPFKRLLAQKKLVFYFLLFFIFLILAFFQRRMIPFLIFFSLPLLFHSSKYIFLPLLQRIERERIITLFVLFAYIIFLCGSIIYYFPNELNDPLKKSATTPSEVITFLKEYKLDRDAVIFNPYDAGGYMLWMMPEQKIIIDGRIPQKEISPGRSILEEYQSIKNGTDQYISSSLEKYNINIVWTRRGSQKDMHSSLEYFLLTHLLFEDTTLLEKDTTKLDDYMKKNWCKVFEINQNSLYIRPNSDVLKNVTCL